MSSIEEYGKKVNQSMSDIITLEDNSNVDLTTLADKNIDRKIKLFLISQAERELIRVLKLTDLLDKMQELFINKIDEDIANRDIQLDEYANIIGVITSLIDRSGKIISRVYSDDSVKNLLIVDNSGGSLSIGGNVSNSIAPLQIPGMEDRHSRDKVRLIVEAALRNIQNDTSEESEPVIIESNSQIEDN